MLSRHPAHIMGENCAAVQRVSRYHCHLRAPGSILSLSFVLLFFFFAEFVPPGYLVSFHFVKKPPKNVPVGVIGAL